MSILNATNAADLELPATVEIILPGKSHETENPYHSRQPVLNCHHENGNR